MNARISLLATVFFVSACATSGPEATESSEQVEVSAAETEAPLQASANPQDIVIDQVEIVQDEDDVVCRRERITGSNISRKICRSTASLAARAAEDQAALRQMRSFRSGSLDDTNGATRNVRAQ